MSVTADLPDLNLGLALACPSIRTEGGEVGHISRHGKPDVALKTVSRAGVTVLLNTNVLGDGIMRSVGAKQNAVTQLARVVGSNL